MSTSFQARATASMAACLALLCALPSQAVEIAPGTTHAFRDWFIPDILTPGVNLSDEPSLAGSVVADAWRPFSMEVTFRSNMSDEVRTFTVSGSVHDWVVRRSDTGTLDFYFSAHMDPGQHFGGVITRPWQLRGEEAVEVHWRDDLVPEGNLPTEVRVDVNGESITARYFARDEGQPNWIFGGSAPVVYRSDLTHYGLGTGELSYAYSPVFGSNTGETVLPFFMPAIPEPSTWLLLGAGLGVLGLRGRRRQGGGR